MIAQHSDNYESARLSSSKYLYENIDAENTDAKDIDEKSIGDNDIDDRNIDEKSIDDNNIDDRSVDERNVDDNDINDRDTDEKSIDDNDIGTIENASQNKAASDSVDVVPKLEAVFDKTCGGMSPRLKWAEDYSFAILDAFVRLDLHQVFYHTGRFFLLVLERPV